MAAEENCRRPSGAVKSFTFRNKKDIEIVFEGRQEFIPTYTTLEKIQGNVNIRFEKDTPIDNLEILFLGQAETWVERVQSMTPAAGRIAAKHNILRSSQPVDGSCLPTDGIAKANVTYTHPFCFVVPEKLLDIACQHKTLTRTGNSDPTRDQHLLLPPSLGDCMVSGAGARLMSDMAPDMAKVRYWIKAIVKKISRASGQSSVEVASQSEKIRIIPAMEAQPPLEVPDDSLDYRLRAEKGVKKGILFPFKRVGHLVAEAAQPPALMLLPPKSPSTCSVTSSTTLNLRFDPKDESTAPPTLDSLSVKLRVFTYFATDRFPSIASRSLCQDWHNERHHYCEDVEISDRPVSSVEWTKHEPLLSDLSVDRRATRQMSVSSTTSRTSGTDPSARPSPSAVYSASLPYYTAQIRVPVVLPQSGRKVFPPTFHSCFLARTYTLVLRLRYHTPKASIPSPSFSLKVPIQIGSHGLPDARPVISEAEMDSIRAREEYERELAEIDEFYRPRRATVAGDAESIPGTERMRMMSIGGNSSIASERQSRNMSLGSSRSGDSSVRGSIRGSGEENDGVQGAEVARPEQDMDNNPFHPSNFRQHLQNRQQEQESQESSLPSYTPIGGNPASFFASNPFYSGGARGGGDIRWTDLTSARTAAIAAYQ